MKTGKATAGDRVRFCRAAFLLFLFLSVGLLSLCCRDRSPQGIRDNSGGETVQKSARRSREKLKDLPYVHSVRDDPHPEKKGVTIHHRKLSWPGVNIYIPGGHRAELLNMDGTILHSWTAPRRFCRGWQYAVMDGAGGLLAIDAVGECDDEALLKLTPDSRLEWISRDHYHHDVSIGPGGEIYAVTKEKRDVVFSGQTVPILDNAIVILTSAGRLKKKISVYDLLGDEIPEEWSSRIAGRVARFGESEKKLRKVLEKKLSRGYDVFHINTLEPIARETAVARAGCLLICSRKLNLIAAVDPGEETIVWQWGKDELDRPHHPTLLDNDNILVFDNGAHRKYSRVIELNPVSGEIVWEYRGDPPESFFSRGRGSAQKLPNGNVLITESNRGRVFEITGDGKIVWEFWNPATDKKNKRQTVYRMLRFPPEILDELPFGPAVDRQPE